jgi:hypothetical protein
VLCAESTLYSQRYLAGNLRPQSLSLLPSHWMSIFDSVALQCAAAGTSWTCLISGEQRVSRRTVSTGSCATLLRAGTWDTFRFIYNRRRFCTKDIRVNCLRQFAECAAPRMLVARGGLRGLLENVAHDSANSG